MGANATRVPFLRSVELVAVGKRWYNQGEKGHLRSKQGSLRRKTPVFHCPPTRYGSRNTIIPLAGMETTSEEGQPGAERQRQ